MRSRESPASFSQWQRLLLAVIVALMSSRTGLSAPVELFRDLHHELHKVAVYRVTMEVYVGGNNVIFRLDQNLTVLKNVTLNSAVTVLEVDYTFGKLLVCWTGSRGQCGYFDLETLAVVPLRQGDPVDFVSPSFADPYSRPIVIQVDQNTSASFPNRSSWIFASPELPSVRRPNPIFSVRDISASTNPSEYYEISTSSYLTRYNQSLEYDVLDGLCVGPSCFFLTLQHNATDGPHYFSRLSSVCSGSLFPYLELPLFEDIPSTNSYRAVALAVGELNAEQYLIVVSVKVDPAQRTPEDDSAGWRLDYTPLTKLQDRLFRIYSDHCTKHSSPSPSWWFQGHFANCTQPPYSGNCTHSRYRERPTAQVVIESNIHTGLHELLHGSTTSPTARGPGQVINVFTYSWNRDEFFTIFIITSNGVVYKVYAETDFQGGLSARPLPATFLDTGQYSDAGQTIKFQQDVVFSNDYYYLLTGSKVIRQPLDYCTALYECHECQKVAGCAWIITRTVCRLKVYMSQDEESDELCPVAVKSVTPLSGPVEGGTQLTFHGTDFRSPSMNLSMCQHWEEIFPFNQSMFVFVVPPKANGTDENCTLTITYGEGMVHSSVFTYKNPTITWLTPQRVLSSDGGSIEFRGHDLDVGFNASVIFISDQINFTCTVIKRFSSNISCMFEALAAIDNASNVSMDSVVNQTEGCDCYDVIVIIDAAQRMLSDVGRLCRCPDPTVTAIEPQLIYERGLTEFEVRGTNLDLAIVSLLVTVQGTTTASPKCSPCSGTVDGTCLRCSLSLNMTSVGDAVGEVTLRMEGPQSRAPVNHTLTLPSPVRVRVIERPHVQIYPTSVPLDPSMCRQVDPGITVLNISIEAVVPAADVSVAVEDGLRRLTCGQCQQIEPPLRTTAAASPRASTKTTTAMTSRRSTTRPATTTKSPPWMTTSAQTSTGTKTQPTPLRTTTMRPSTTRPTTTRRPSTIFTNSTAITATKTTPGPSSLKTSSAATGSTFSSGRPVDITTASSTPVHRTFHCLLSLNLVTTQHLKSDNSCHFNVTSSHQLDIWVDLGNHHHFKLGCLAVSNSSVATGAEGSGGASWWRNLPVLVGPGAGIVVLLATIVLVCYARRKRHRFLQRRRRHLEMKQSASSSGGLLRPSTSSEGSPESEFVSVEHMLIRSGDRKRLQEVRDSGLIIPRQRLNIGKVVGHGNFGCVHEGDLRVNESNDNDMLPVAIKTLLDAGSRSVDLQGFVNEALLMKNFHHDHVLGLLGLADGDLGPLVILPFMERGDLLAFIKKKDTLLSVGDVLRFSTDIASGMDYLASNKFVHRDLAARNCMLDSQLRVKVADFGLCRDVYEKGYYRSDNKKKLPIRWMAVESIENGAYTSKSDVWSFGVVIWEMTTRGTTPYPGVEGWDILRYLTAGRRLDQPYLCPNSLYDLMGKCWHQEPLLRPTFHELLQDLKTLFETLQDSRNASDALSMSSPITFPDCHRFRDDAALVARVKAAALMNYSLARVIEEVCLPESAENTNSCSFAPEYLELINTDLPPSRVFHTCPEEKTNYSKMHPDGFLRSENQEPLTEQAHSAVEVRHPKKENASATAIDEGYFLLENRAGVCSVVSNDPKPNSASADIIKTQTTEQSSLLSQNHEASLREDAAVDKLVQTCTSSNVPLNKKRPLVSTKPKFQLHNAVQPIPSAQVIDESSESLLVNEGNITAQTPVDEEDSSNRTQEKQPSRMASPGIAVRNSSVATHSEIQLNDMMSQNVSSGKAIKSDQTVKSDGYFMLEGSSTTKL